MRVESDPKIVFGGDANALGKIDGGYGSLGGLILSDLQKGGSRPSFVSEINHKFTI